MWLRLNSKIDLTQSAHPYLGFVNFLENCSLLHCFCPREVNLYFSLWLRLNSNIGLTQTAHPYLGFVYFLENCSLLHCLCPGEVNIYFSLWLRLNSIFWVDTDCPSSLSCICLLFGKLLTFTLPLPRCSLFFFPKILI